MAILSEGGLRRIIKRQLEERYSLEMTRGDVSFRKCDLSNLSSSELAVWYAKHFVYNPSITIKPDDNSMPQQIDKSAFLSFLRGEDSFGLEPNELIEYENEVRKMVTRGGSNLVSKYVTALEYSITYLFGVMAPAVCAFLNQIIPVADSESDRVASISDDDTVSTTNTAGVAATVNKAISSAATKFVRSHGSNARTTQAMFSESFERVVYPEEYAFLLPNTFIALMSDDEPGAQQIFVREKQQLSKIVSEVNASVSVIIDHFRSHYSDFSGSDFAESLDSALKSLASRDDSVENGRLVQTALYPIITDAIMFYESRF